MQVNSRLNYLKLAKKKRGGGEETLKYHKGSNSRMTETAKRQELGEQGPPRSPPGASEEATARLLTGAEKAATLIQLRRRNCRGWKEETSGPCSHKGARPGSPSCLSPSAETQGSRLAEQKHGPQGSSIAKKVTEWGTGT